MLTSNLNVYLLIYFHIYTNITNVHYHEFQLMYSFERDNFH